MIFTSTLNADDRGYAAIAARMVELAAEQPLGYYSQVLALFALGHLDGLYRFEADGALTPAWTSAAATTWRRSLPTTAPNIWGWRSAARPTR